MNKAFEPDRQFVDRLEWQLAAEYRRINRRRSSERVAVPRPVLAFALAAGVLLTGVAAIKAADFVHDAWRKKIEVARAETDVLLQQARLESGREMAERTRALAEKGMVRQEEYHQLKIGQERAALDLERSRLNLEEVRHSGVSPRNELYAPFVGGRDFVSERLAVETREIELDIRLLVETLERLKDLREKALVRAEEPDALEKEIVSRRARIDEIGQRLELRKRFLDGKVSARAVEIEGRLAVAEANLRSAQSKVDVLAARMIRLQALQAEGMVSPTETVGMQYALDSARAELKLAALEVDILKKAL